MRIPVDIFAPPMYQILRSILFLFGPETAHSIAMNVLKLACSIGFMERLVRRWFLPREKPVSLFGLNFRNPVGMGAGFDKNANYLRELHALGFGFVEIGTVTPKAQAGNEKPRLFRLPKDHALINRMGFNNDGVDKIVERLRAWKKQQDGQSHPMLVGGNIGKNKSTPNEEAWKDYEKCFLALHPFVDFFVVNVSSPNTPGLRQLQDKDALGQILMNLQAHNRKIPVPRPVLLKIAPDLTPGQVDDVIALAMEIHLDGIVATNTTISRDSLRTDAKRVERIGNGGLSGLPLKERSTEMIRYIHQKTSGTIPIIGSGGIFTAADAQQKLNAGASLVEIWTGFIYEGPGLMKRICAGINPS
ncbi:MAG TPA: quinone-dependent dihydroorotate dehydrogenase [Flavisolibacter sp.]